MVIRRFPSGKATRRAVENAEISACRRQLHLAPGETSECGRREARWDRSHERPRDARGRNVDPFEAPEDYEDPWRGRRVPILVAALAVIVLVVVLIIILS
jgi:hypothetical protein